MRKNFGEAEKEIAANREEIINKLVGFGATDALLFWGHNDDLVARQEKLWIPIILWARKALNASLETTQGLDIPQQNLKLGDKLRIFIEGLDNRELTAYYLAALDMRSVILAAALVKGQITADEAYKAAWLEELWQAEKWGVDPEAESKRLEMRNELREIEAYLKGSPA